MQMDVDIFLSFVEFKNLLMKCILYKVEMIPFEKKFCSFFYMKVFFSKMPSFTVLLKVFMTMINAVNGQSLLSVIRNK